MAGKTPLFVNGNPGGPVDHTAEETRARDLAHRYRCEFVDLREFPYRPRSVPLRSPWT